MDILSSALLLFLPWFFLVPHQVSFIAVLSFLWGEKKQHTHLSLQLGLWQLPTEKPLMIHDCLHTEVLTLPVRWEFSQIWPPSHLLSHHTHSLPFTHPCAPCQASYFVPAVLSAWYPLPFLIQPLAVYTHFKVLKSSQPLSTQNSLS